MTTLPRTPRNNSTGMKLALLAIEKEGVIRVAVSGSVTTTDFSADGINPLETLLGAGWSSARVMLDLKHTSYIDSSAIGWLIGTHRAFKDAGGKFVVHSLQPAVRQILGVLKIGRAISITADEASAHTLIDGGAA